MCQASGESASSVATKPVATTPVATTTVALTPVAPEYCPAATDHPSSLTIPQLKAVVNEGIARNVCIGF